LIKRKHRFAEPEEPSLWTVLKKICGWGEKIGGNLLTNDKKCCIINSVNKIYMI
jgi:hypothetical protein